MQNENTIQEQEDVAREYLDYDFSALNRDNPIPSQMEYAMKKPNYIKLYIYLADIGSQLALRFVEKKATPFNYHVFEETMLSIVEKYIMNNNYDYCVQAFSSGQLTNDSRRKIWEKIGRLIYERYNLLGAMQMLTNFKDPIAINYIRKAIIQSELSNLEPDFITLLKIPDVELPDTKRILTYYVIRELFFENQQYILNENRYNRTLNLQWAIDIKNQLPN